MDQHHDQLHREIPKSLTYDELIQLVAELKAIIRAQAEIIQKQEETLRLQAEEIKLLKEENKLLKKKLYGSSSERGKRNSSGDSGTAQGASQNNVPPKDPLSGNAPTAGKGGKTKRTRALSEQYPNAEVRDEVLGFDFIRTTAYLPV